MNGFTRIPSLVLAGLFLIAASDTVSAADKPDVDIKDTIKKTFEVRPGGSLYLDLDRGDVEVRIGSNNEVMIEVVRIIGVDSRAEAKEMLEAHELNFDHDGDDVSLESRFDDDAWNWKRWRDKNRFRMTVTVLIPQDYDVEVTSGAGNIRAESIEGDIDIRTGAGNVDIGHIRGGVEISTGSGNISVSSVDGGMDVRAGAGNIMIGDVRGELNAHTGAGNISARITRQPDKDSNLMTGAGNVTAYLADDISVNVDASAKVGSCSTDFPLRVEGKWMSKSFAGDINGGGPDLVLRSGVGNVSLKQI
ncbi:MAG: DUF4097 family beta strand repeat protein [Rhodothermales bacterium]|nr:DUF4097 family beta strand repeat protein [Rhodothermales bacterium]